LTNQFLGLARGPIDHDASSVINAIANEAIDMGSAVALTTTIPTSELLPRVEETTTGTDITYGIAVGGDTDGVYGDGSVSTDDSTRAAASAGQGVVVVTQGRCLAKVEGKSSGVGDISIAVGDALAPSTVSGVLLKALITIDQPLQNSVIARALQPVASGESDIIAVDVQREGIYNDGSASWLYSRYSKRGVVKLDGIL